MAEVSLITGANKGIGFEVGRQLGQAGLLLGSRDVSRGEQAASTLRAEGVEAHAVKVDLDRAAECAATLAE